MNKLQRKEYLASELPDDVRAAYNQATFLLGNQHGNVGFTLGGIRYRIYGDETIRAAAKAIGVHDLIEALKGVDVPAEQVEAAMDRLKLDAAEREAMWREINESEAEMLAD